MSLDWSCWIKCVNSFCTTTEWNHYHWWRNFTEFVGHTCFMISARFSFWKRVRRLIVAGVFFSTNRSNVLHPQMQLGILLGASHSSAYSMTSWNRLSQASTTSTRNAFLTRASTPSALKPVTEFAKNTVEPEHVVVALVGPTVVATSIRSNSADDLMVQLVKLEVWVRVLAGARVWSQQMGIFSAIFNI